ncbi:MAG: bepC [Hyphomicrobiales bacterium]|nr:bepC [Hyphomicrobiales bacterium]
MGFATRPPGGFVSKADRLTAARFLGSIRLAIGVCAGVSASVGVVSAETISGALAKAYVSSPDLNAQRAATRGVDENIARTQAGYRPTVSATADFGLQHTETTTNRVGSSGGSTSSETFPRGVGVTVTQNIWNGNRTINGVRQADSQVLQSREQIRVTEQTLLGNAATSYMNVLRDTAILNLRRNNVEVLEEQLRQTRDRFSVGEVTRTDVAQSEAALAQGRSDAFVAQSNLQVSLANYRQFIGEQPRSLAPAQPLVRLTPRTLDTAIALSQKEHPAIQSALHNADAAEIAIKLAEGQLYPTLGVTGAVTRRYDLQNQPGSRQYNASVVGLLSVPIYEGGAVYAQVRQAKEQFGQARLLADVQREQVRAFVVSSWGVWQNSRQLVDSVQAQVRAAEIALNGVREEARVGQRTTLDVLNAQQALLNARVNLVTAQRDRVVSSYALLASVGQLSARTLGLAVANYDPTIHYEQVKDKWIGLRTPDGR